MVWSGWLALAFVWLCVLASASGVSLALAGSGELVVQDQLADDIHGVGHELERIQTQAAGSRRDFGPGDVVQHEEQQAANDDSASSSASASSASSASASSAASASSRVIGRLVAAPEDARQDAAHRRPGSGSG